MNSVFSKLLKWFGCVTVVAFVQTAFDTPRFLDVSGL